MYRAWTTSADDPGQVAHDLEVHLNEYAGEIISVGYAVDARHHVLVVYRPVDLTAENADEAVAIAESIIDESHA